MFYVIEIQTTNTGATNTFCFNTRADAEEKYHDVLRVASKSEVKKHGAMIVNDDMFVIKSEVYVHEEVNNK